jgi:hypothetical protein
VKSQAAEHGGLGEGWQKMQQINISKRQVLLLKIDSHIRRMTTFESDITNKVRGEAKQEIQIEGPSLRRPTSRMGGPPSVRVGCCIAIYILTIYCRG